MVVCRTYCTVNVADRLIDYSDAALQLHAPHCYPPLPLLTTRGRSYSFQYSFASPTAGGIDASGRPGLLPVGVAGFPLAGWTELPLAASRAGGQQTADAELPARRWRPAGPGRSAGAPAVEPVEDGAGRQGVPASTQPPSAASWIARPVGGPVEGVGGGRRARHLSTAIPDRLACAGRGRRARRAASACGSGSGASCPTGVAGRPLTHAGSWTSRRPSTTVTSTMPGRAPHRPRRGHVRHRRHAPRLGHRYSPSRA